MAKEISRPGFVHSGTSLKALKLIVDEGILQYLYVFEGFVRFLYFCSCLLNV